MKVETVTTIILTDEERMHLLNFIDRNKEADDNFSDKSGYDYKANKFAKDLYNKL